MSLTSVRRKVMEHIVFHSIMQHVHATLWHIAYLSVQGV